MKREVIEAWREKLAMSPAASLPVRMTLPAIAASAAHYANSKGRPSLATWMPRVMAEGYATSTDMVRWTSESPMTGPQSPAADFIRKQYQISSVPSNTRHIARVMSSAKTADDIDSIMILIGSIMTNFVPGSIDFKHQAYDDIFLEERRWNIKDYSGINWCTPNLGSWSIEAMRTMQPLDAIVFGWAETLRDWVVITYEPHILVEQEARKVTDQEIHDAWRARKDALHARRIEKRRAAYH